VCGNLDAVTLLLDAGADVTTVVKKSGRTTLHMAASTGSAPVIQVLLDRVLRLAIEDRFETALDKVKVTEQEKEAKERTWMRPFEKFVQRKDKYKNQTALEIALGNDPGGVSEAVKLLQAAEERIARRAWEIEQV
jgi:ankyrin repeat protein